MKAGDYNTRLEWLRKSKGSRDSFGQREDPYTPAGYLWGAVEDVAAGRTTEKQSEKQLTSATIRIRNFPDVAAGDKLREVASGAEWEVLTVVDGDNEIEIEAER
jgi:head-tail adaptor